MPSSSGYRAAFAWVPEVTAWVCAWRGRPSSSRRSRDRLSAPVAPGAIQVAGGQLIILGVACGTMGGYPHVAHVISADLDRVGQLCPGDQVVFRPGALARPEAGSSRPDSRTGHSLPDREPGKGRVRQILCRPCLPALEPEPLGRERPRHDLIERRPHPLEDGLVGRVLGEVARLAGIIAQVEQLLAIDISLANPDIDRVVFGQRRPRLSILEQLSRGPGSRGSVGTTSESAGDVEESRRDRPWLPEGGAIPERC